MKIPEVSVITANFNHAKWISRCIRSVNNQEFINNIVVEHIIIDDCSTDNSLEVIEKYNTGNVVLIKNKKNFGLPNSLNIAIKKSRGRYVVRLDSDDYLSRNFIYIHKLFLDLNRNYSAISSDYIHVDDKENNLDRKFSKENFIACGIMFRREVLFELGLYNEKFKFREGHELMKRFLELNYILGYSNLPLYKYRMHDNNRSKLPDIDKFDKKLKENE